ncbi:MAG: hypothetical protein F2799_01010 [Actinobacteria bacterium]|uniref:Unannotated protein n=1 Tax=freshwater metagenome TaxID=449393 RepID=A0A6J7CZC9_9ZZZZ|nr:hypothetical protein [Actinomycetota bacterium]
MLKRYPIGFMLAAAVLLSACGTGAGASGSLQPEAKTTAHGSASASGATTTVPTTTAPKLIGGGSAKCTAAAALKAAQAALHAKEVAMSQNVCADGWMVVLAGTGGEAGYLTTFVFQAEGPFWVPQQREKVCVQPSPVPRKIYGLACSDS